MVFALCYRERLLTLARTLVMLGRACRICVETDIYL